MHERNYIDRTVSFEFGVHVCVCVYNALIVYRSTDWRLVRVWMLIGCHVAVVTYVRPRALIWFHKHASMDVYIWMLWLKFIVKRWSSKWRKLNVSVCLIVEPHNCIPLSVVDSFTKRFYQCVIHTYSFHSIRFDSMWKCTRHYAIWCRIQSTGAHPKGTLIATHNTTKTITHIKFSAQHLEDVKYKNVSYQQLKPKSNSFSLCCKSFIIS